jgi:hypothetical protein
MFVIEIILISAAVFICCSALTGGGYYHRHHWRRSIEGEDLASQYPLSCDAKLQVSARLTKVDGQWMMACSSAPVDADRKDTTEYFLQKITYKDGARMPQTGTAELRCKNAKRTVGSTKMPYMKSKDVLQCFVVEDEPACDDKCGVEQVPPLASYRRRKMTNAASDSKALSEA